MESTTNLLDLFKKKKMQQIFVTVFDKILWIFKPIHIHRFIRSNFFLIGLLKVVQEASMILQVNLKIIIRTKISPSGFVDLSK